MKIHHNFHFVLLLLTLLLCMQLFAQDKPKDELYMLHQDVIKVDKVSEFEEAVTKLFDLWREHGMEMTIKYASKTDDNRYNFLVPLNSYADIDKHDEYWANLSKKAGEEALGSIMASMNDTYVSHKNITVKRLVDLSYWPEDNRLKDETVKFLHFDHYYFKEGEIGNAMKMMKEFKELMMKKKSKDGYNVWMHDIGGDAGHLVVTRAAKNNVDYYQTSNDRYASMAEELKSMWPKFSKTLKKFSHNNGKPMPDFRYSPEK